MPKIVFVLTLYMCIMCATSVDIQSDGISLDEGITHLIEKQEFEVELPYIGSHMTLDARNLDNDEFNMKLQLSPKSEARKSKLKKIFAPILIVVILKAITLIPLALGLLGLKTWNAIQLSFVTFVVSVALAVYEMCKKIAVDHIHPVVSHTAPWPVARGMDNQMAAHHLAYSEYNK